MYYVDFPLPLYVTEVIEAESEREAREIVNKLLDRDSFLDYLSNEFACKEPYMENMNDPEFTPYSPMIGTGADEVTLTREYIKYYMEH